MKQNKCAKGFTLIELLVVVLIVGILAAFGASEYKKVIEHSRASEAVNLLRALYVGEEAYLLAHGEYASSLDDLDLSFQGEKKACVAGQSKTPCVGYYNTDEVWNKEWAIGLEGGKNPSISVMRIKGPYMGTGFFMQMDRKDGVQYPLRKFACVENNVGKKYKGKADSYCVDIMDSEFYPTQSKTVRKYAIVWQ